MRKAALNPKAKEVLLSVAQTLMLTKGYEATSVDEICQKAKLTKGSFFHYFKSKEDLAKTLLERFCCSSFTAMENCCQECTANDPLARVYAHIDFAIQRVKGSMADQGCLLGVLAQEMSETHPEIRSLCQKGFEEWAKIFKKDLIAAKTKYAPRADFAVESLAEYFIAVIEGSLILAKVKRDKKVIQRNLVHFRDYIKSLLKR